MAMADGDAPSTHQRLNASTFPLDLRPSTLNLELGTLNFHSGTNFFTRPTMKEWL